MLYSSGDDNQHHEGVAVILKKGMEECKMEWKPINSRLMKVRMKGKHTNITKCYALTNDSEEESKDAFCNQSAVGKKMATGTFTYNALRTKTLKERIKTQRRIVSHSNSTRAMLLV